MEINNKNYEQYASVIQNIKTPYNSKQDARLHHEAISIAKTNQIKRFFKKQANLDLDTIEKSNKTTWEKAIELASFVAKNIPHDNQKIGLYRKNAMSLWEYSRKVPTGFNCRWHAILLSELLLAIGIKNCFVTCLPEDKNDNDCHVVNLVWLEETKSWAMIDSDMIEYVVDENERPLSLKEMREFIMDNKEFYVRPLPGFEDAWISSKDGLEFQKCYWAKNLFWFARHTTYGYNLESEFRKDDSYICLVPEGYHYEKSKFIGDEMSNDITFWDL